MIRHVLKIIRNSWKSFYGIFIEQAVVCVILMLVVVSVCVTLGKFYSPGLLNTEHTVSFGYMLEEENANTKVIAECVDVVVENLKKLDCVEGITQSRAMIPYLRDHAWYDSIRIDKKMYRVNYKGADEDAYNVFLPEIEEGKWLSDKMLDDGSYTCVISRQLVDELKWEKPVGHKIIMREKEFTVVGVIAGIKHRVLQSSDPTVIMPCSAIGYNSVFRELCARVKPWKEKEFIMAYYKEFQRLIPTVEAQPFAMEMSIARRASYSTTVIHIMLQAVPTIFLFIFAFIGTFGLFIQNSGKRVREYALRLAVGASPGELLRFVILESIIVTSLACVPGLVLSVFIYEYTWSEMAGVVGTVIIMILFSVMSVWYPAYQVTKVNPAVALK